MKLSLIIVNHNLCDLLRQALNSLISVGFGVDYEVIIVDNASIDGSIDMLASEFSQCRIICNNETDGIAKSYNKAIKLSKGEYVLLVNADTICGKETLKRVVDFMDSQTIAAGVGVRMLSPQGSFLQESNRGLTKAWVSFLKLTGFGKNLPKTRLANRNPKAWVEEFQTSEVDILNGAFMLLRKSVLNEVGLFDERFIQYGHDIDLSYRIKQAGYKNYYFPKTYIINLKVDEQVNKLSWHYLRNFYGAMFLFTTKHIFKMPELRMHVLPWRYARTLEVEG